MICAISCSGLFLSSACGAVPDLVRIERKKSVNFRRKSFWQVFRFKLLIQGLNLVLCVTNLTGISSETGLDCKTKLRPAKLFFENTVLLNKTFLLIIQKEVRGVTRAYQKENHRIESFIVRHIEFQKSGKKFAITNHEAIILKSILKIFCSKLCQIRLEYSL